jgi:hypothetical protein
LDVTRETLLWPRSAQAVGAYELKLNAPWLRAVLGVFPSSVPTAFQLADGFVRASDAARRPAVIADRLQLATFTAAAGARDRLAGCRSR